MRVCSLIKVKGHRPITPDVLNFYTLQYITAIRTPSETL